MGKYDSFKQCVARNRDKRDPKAYCGAIKARAEKEGNSVDEHAAQQRRKYGKK